MVILFSISTIHHRFLNVTEFVAFSSCFGCSENTQGDIVRVNVSQPQRDPHFCVSMKQANEWYSAMNLFLNLAHDPKNLISFKMNEGELIMRNLKKGK